MAKFIIEGGRKLKGVLPVSSAKNSAVSLLCAALMVKGEVTLRDVPRIEEVDRILEILESLGVGIAWRGEHTLVLDTRGDLEMVRINKHACEVTRSSMLLLGALAKREKKYRLYKSGGCKLGERTVRPHLYALEKLGVTARSRDKYYEVVTNNLQGTEIIMYESGDTPTENAIMAAVLAEGETVIKFASANYMVQDLCFFLNRAGAKIEGIGSTTLRIRGVAQLKNKIEYAVMPDPIVAMAYISIAITTASPLTIAGCPMEFLELELEKLRVMGQKFSLKNERQSNSGKFRLADVVIEPSPLSALPDKIYGRPFPGLNIDNLPFFVPIFTRARGRSLVHDWVYENRAIYYLELQKLGAKITLLDPHRVFVEGPTKFRANELICPPAIRPAMIVLIAMLAAPGRSVLRNPYPIERGYEKVTEVLSAVGAKIEKVADIN
ncbi:MAG TPA: UDP-N-acetylglucosamine 1-carboxyvinyltransferase [Candidatus Magasanikbacteria bacterium]|nr:UDP-N-acetylglucosamine 1-carboxyvinyltransferase [Candidatus Magasanikbacteria bacterium]